MSRAGWPGSARTVPGLLPSASEAWSVLAFGFGEVPLHLLWLVLGLTLAGWRASSAPFDAPVLRRCSRRCGKSSFDAAGLHSVWRLDCVAGREGSEWACSSIAAPVAASFTKGPPRRPRWISSTWYCRCVLSCAASRRDAADFERGRRSRGPEEPFLDSDKPSVATGGRHRRRTARRRRSAHARQGVPDGRRRSSAGSFSLARAPCGCSTVPRCLRRSRTLPMPVVTWSSSERGPRRRSQCPRSWGTNLADAKQQLREAGYRNIHATDAAGRQGRAVAEELDRGRPGSADGRRPSARSADHSDGDPRPVAGSARWADVPLDPFEAIADEREALGVGDDVQPVRSDRVRPPPQRQLRRRTPGRPGLGSPRPGPQPSARRQRLPDGRADSAPSCRCSSRPASGTAPRRRCPREPVPCAAPQPGRRRRTWSRSRRQAQHWVPDQQRRR